MAQRGVINKQTGHPTGGFAHWLPHNQCHQRRRTRLRAHVRNPEPLLSTMKTVYDAVGLDRPVVRDMLVPSVSKRRLPPHLPRSRGFASAACAFTRYPSAACTDSRDRSSRRTPRRTGSWRVGSGSSIAYVSTDPWSGPGVVEVAVCPLLQKTRGRRTWPQRTGEGDQPVFCARRPHINLLKIAWSPWRGRSGVSRGLLIGNSGFSSAHSASPTRQIAGRPLPTLRYRQLSATSASTPLSAIDWRRRWPGGGLVPISGEVGVGKTALTEWLYAGT
jgi:hypothetical protein